MITSVELDRLGQGWVRKIASAEITIDSGPVPPEALGPASRVGVTLDDGRQCELFSFFAHERAFAAEDFVGLTVDAGRRLKFASDHRLDLGPRIRPRAIR